ncbi:hypothetical protein [Cohnella luojiensis]|uniref:PD-(D/E)XK endonuclease-like domain-containing protein n=1 Tax=Cohnella luojiensis TaxID=652876 RepID=A0A4Y8LWV9_9BACL|nr:hypothetical protein [Cohnella luojiensis]TFE25601.1 hypothetical protein E2980_13520 [Cohnella luojiensis]
MPSQMIAYNHLLKLEECAELKPYRGKNVLHICATVSLFEGIKSRYEEFEWLENAGPFINGILGTWTRPTTKLTQFARLTNIIREEGADPHFPERLTYAFRHNQQNVLLSMRVLTEMGMKPIDFSPSTKEEELFQRCWRRMENEISSFGRTRALLQTPELFKAQFKWMLSENRKQWPEFVVLHGFYFITPLQHRILTLLEANGIGLIFLNLYDERYPNTFASVEAYLGSWVNRAAWKYSVQPTEGLNYGDQFSSAFEGTLVKPSQDIWPPEVYKFLDFSEFLDHYKVNESLYISPKEGSLNGRLKEYVPDSFEQRHFLSYPIGQYLYHLHLMWNERKSRLELTEKGLFECFSSGWLLHDDQNGRAYLKQLQELLPYFQGCVILADWRKRAKLLLQIQEGPVEAFAQSENRFHRIAENPMIRFSYFNVPAKDVRVVTNLIEALFVQAELLFSGSRQVTIREHFEKLEQFMDAGIQSAEFNETEKKLFHELLERFRRDFSSDEAFYVEDLSYAISLYLGGEFLQDENQPEMKPIRQFEDADGAALLGSDVHLCGIDEESLPYTSSPLPWPMTRDTLRSISTCQEEISLLFMREEFAPQIARYLYYSVLAFAENVTISWIRNFDNLTYDESAYISLLGVEPAGTDYGALFQAGTAPTIFKEDADAVQPLLMDYPVDAAAEAALCPRRFYYSILSKPYAVYSSDFHQQFLYQALLEAGYKLSDSSDEDVTQQMSELFPHWSKVRKRMIAEQAIQYKDLFDMKYSSIGDRDYVRGRERFQFLVNYYKDHDNGGIDLMEPARDAMRYGQSGRTLLEHVRGQDELQLEAKPSKLCRFCPHLSQCRDGHYAIDDQLRSIQ